MRIFSVVSVIFCALIVAITSKLQIENLSKSNNELVKDVLLTLQSKRENFVISPLSVYITISLLQTVLLQINDYDVEKLKDEYKTLFPNINSTDVNFHVGNKFFVQHGVEFSDFVKDLAMQVFQVEMQAIDFKDKQNALSIVNAWASEHTKGKITTIVDDDLSDSTEILLVNAIYFQSDWDVQFNSLLTHKEPFYVTPTNVRHGEMMYTLNNMEYALDPGLNCEIVKLQYKNPNFNFILVIPSTSLDDVEMTLINHLDIILDFNAPRRRIQLTMPKFKISKKLDLEATLKKLHLIKVNGQRNNFVDKLIHESFIEVNENGTKAAAVSGALKRRMLDRNIHEIIVDRPFAFLVTMKHNRANILLFFGKVIDPFI